MVQHSCTPSGAPDLRRPRGESPAPPSSTHGPLWLLLVMLVNLHPWYGAFHIRASELSYQSLSSCEEPSIQISVRRRRPAAIEVQHLAIEFVQNMRQVEPSYGAARGKLVPSCNKLGSKLGPCWANLGQPRWDQIGPSWS